MNPTCEHVDIGCCEPCYATWSAARTVMHRETHALDGPSRDIPHDREFPDSDAWVDRDGTVHDTGTC